MQLVEVVLFEEHGEVIPIFAWGILSNKLLSLVDSKKNSGNFKGTETQDLTCNGDAMLYQLS